MEAENGDVNNDRTDMSWERSDSTLSSTSTTSLISSTGKEFEPNEWHHAKCVRNV